MGIRFSCPNGHRLHVKAFLAGKRGICPHCEARFWIPLESQITDSRAVAPAVRTPPGGPRNNGSVESAGSQPIAIAQEQPFVLAEPFGQDAPLPPTAQPDALLEALRESPSAVWYVRPPSGGEYGPAHSDLLQLWIDEGRVGPDCLVWREGWSNWKPAGPVFFPPIPDDEPVPAVPDAPSPPPAPPSANLPPPDALREAVRVRRQTAGKGRSIAAIVVLTLMIVVLLVMLLMVLLPST
jgi:hypothetical protein